MNRTTTVRIKNRNIYNNDNNKNNNFDFSFLKNNLRINNLVPV